MLLSKSLTRVVVVTENNEAIPFGDNQGIEIIENADGRLVLRSVDTSKPFAVFNAGAWKYWRTNRPYREEE